MVVNAEPSSVRAVLIQMIKYTAQLARCDQDPDVDVGAVADACHERLAVLQTLLGTGTPSASFPGDTSMKEGDPPLEELLLVVQQQIRECTGALERSMNRVERELNSMRRIGKAIRAYGNR